MNTVLCLAITVVGWGLYHIFAKIGSRTLSPAAMQFIACLCSIAVAPLYYSLINKSNIKWSAPGIAWTIAAFVATAIGTFSYIYVLTQKDVSQVVGYATSYPILTMLVAIVFMGEAFSLSKLLGLLLVLAGIFVSSRG